MKKEKIFLPLIICIFLSVLSLLSCTHKPKDGWYKKYYNNGKIRSEEYYKNGVKEGIHRYYFSDALLYREESYKNGKLDGVLKNYGARGNLISEEHYKEGILIQDNAHKLKLSIKTDKEVYSVGEDIKVIYMLSNIGERPVGFFCEDCFSSKLEVSEDKKYETFHQWCQVDLGGQAKILQPNDSWTTEENFAYIRVGEVYKYSGSKFDGTKKLYYNGFHIDIPCGNTLLIKNGYGRYKLSSSFCASAVDGSYRNRAWVEGRYHGDDFDAAFTILQNPWTGCIDSNVVEIQIEE